MGKARLNRPSAPFYVQLEITDACNQNCFFCYNETNRESGAPLGTEELRRILEEMRVAGVFSVNFNGGEPLLRPDFFELAEYASSLGFDIHLNTNATLIDDSVAERLSRFFPSVCVGARRGGGHLVRDEAAAADEIAAAKAANVGCHAITSTAGGARQVNKNKEMQKRLVINGGLYMGKTKAKARLIYNHPFITSSCISLRFSILLGR